MNKRLLVLMSLVMVLGLTAGLIGAITFGVPDGNGHPHVGTLLFVQNGEGYYSCTGTLLSSTVMLTADIASKKPGIPMM